MRGLRGEGRPRETALGHLAVRQHGVFIFERRRQLTNEPGRLGRLLLAMVDAPSDAIRSSS